MTDELQSLRDKNKGRVSLADVQKIIDEKGYDSVIICGWKKRGKHELFLAGKVTVADLLMSEALLSISATNAIRGS